MDLVACNIWSSAECVDLRSLVTVHGQYMVTIYVVIAAEGLNLVWFADPFCNATAYAYVERNPFKENSLKPESFKAMQ